MSALSRIPFARQLSDGRMVDVSEVPRGKACNCECPSCGLPVIARQGTERDWHFAHSVTAEASGDTTVCEYSTLVSIRLMAHQILADIKTIRVPHGPGETSHQERRLSIDEIEIGGQFEDVRVDALASVQGYPFVIYLTYPSREPPASLWTPSHQEAGILKIALDSLLRVMENDDSWSSINSGNRQWLSRELLDRWLVRSIESKSWIYHPRQAQALAEAQALTLKSRPTRTPPTVQLDDNRPLLARYRCGQCGESWIAGFDEEDARICPKCKNTASIRVSA